MPLQIDNRLLSRDAKPNSFTYHSPNHSWVVSPITKPLALTGEESNHRLCNSHLVLASTFDAVLNDAHVAQINGLVPKAVGVRS